MSVLKERLDRWRTTRGIARLRSGVWMIEPSYFDAFLHELDETVSARMKPRERFRQAEETKIEEGVLRVPVKGVLMHDVPWIFDFYGIEATSSRKLREAIDAAAKNDAVKQIHFDVDSPGGEVSGMFELAESIKAVRPHKRITAHTDDLAASAAYLIASQADRFTASPGALVGSIGVLSVMHDTSGFFGTMGVKPIVVKSGPFKGTGEPGTPITPEQIADRQRVVDGYAKRFTEAVAEGRRMTTEQVGALATGQLFHTDEALTSRLIDGITSDPLPRSLSPIEEKIEPTPGGEPGASMEEEVVPLDKAQLEEFEQLKQERATWKVEREQLIKRIEAGETTLRSITDKQKADMLEAAAREGRITAENKKSVDFFAAVASPEQLREFLGSCPLQARTTPVGATPQNSGAVESDQAELARKMGIDPELMRLTGQAKAIFSDGSMRLRDGTFVPAPAGGAK